MKLKTRVILIYLCTQVFIGGLFLISVMLDTAAMVTGGFIGGLLLVVIAALLISHVILSFVLNYPKELLRSGLLWSFFIWLFLAPLIIVIVEVAGDEYYKHKKLTTEKERGIKLGEKMGLTNFRWDSKINRFRFNGKSGLEHVVYVGEKTLNLIAKAKLPENSDTLVWLRTALYQAEPYLSNFAYNVLDSCILNKSYKMQSLISFSIFSKKKEQGDIWIQSDACYNLNGYHGDICVTIPILPRTIKSATADINN